MESRSNFKSGIVNYLSDFWKIIEEHKEWVDPNSNKINKIISSSIKEEHKKNYPIEQQSYWGEDSGVKKFLQNRKKCFSWDESKFKNSVVVPKVNRLKGLDDEVKNDVVEVLKHYSVPDLGCHNLSDRISLLNPKKYGSVRGIVSVPKFGLKNEILKITDGEYTQIKINDSHSWDSSSMIDENGNMWFSHSWNVIKDLDSPFYGTHFDANTISWKFLGEFYSVNYRYENQIFDFNSFDQEQMKKISEWLDYEVISLYINSGDSKPFWNYYQDTTLGTGNYLDLLLEACEEIGSEKGFKHLFPLYTYELSKRMENDGDSLLYDTINLSEEVHEQMFRSWRKKIKKRRGDWRNTKNNISRIIDLESNDWEKLVGDETTSEIREQVCVDFYKRLLPDEISQKLNFNG